MTRRFMGVVLSLLVAIPVVAAGAGAKAPKATKELIAKGQAAYQTNCVSCHGEKGDGAGPAGTYLQPPPRNFGKEPFKLGAKPEEVFKTITEGMAGTTMVGYSTLSEEERWGLTYYVLGFTPSTEGKKLLKLRVK